MRPLENLYYAIGQMAYAIAVADGEVMKEERQQFFDLVEAGLRSAHYDFDISSIIFQVMDKDRVSTEDSYHRAMNQIRLNSHYLYPELKAKFVEVMEKIANAYPPVSIEESLLIDRFKRDIAPIHGDPVYYSKYNSLK